jgi:hypothetical protein
LTQTARLDCLGAVLQDCGTDHQHSALEERDATTRCSQPAPQSNQVTALDVMPNESRGNTGSHAAATVSDLEIGRKRSQFGV